MRHALAVLLVAGTFFVSGLHAGEFEDSVVSVLQEWDASISAVKYDFYRCPVDFKKTDQGWDVEDSSGLLQQSGADAVRGRVHFSFKDRNFSLTEAFAEPASDGFVILSRTFASSTAGLTVATTKSKLAVLPDSMFWSVDMAEKNALGEVRRLAEIREKADISKVITAGKTIIEEYYDRAAIGLVPPFVLTLNEGPMPLGAFLSRSRELKLLKAQVTQDGLWDIIAESRTPAYMFRILWDPTNARMLNGRRGGCKKCASMEFDDWLTHDEFVYEYEGTESIPSSVKLVKYEEDREVPVVTGETKQGLVWYFGNGQVNPPEDADSFTVPIIDGTQVRNFIKKTIHTQGEDPKDD